MGVAVFANAWRQSIAGLPMRAGTRAAAMISQLAAAVLLAMAYSVAGEVVRGRLVAPGGGYPRAVQLPDGTQLVCAGEADRAAGTKSLVVWSRSAGAGGNWTRAGVVIQAPLRGTDLANCMLVPGAPPADAESSLGCNATVAPGSARPEASVVALFRLHTGCGSGGCQAFSLQSARSPDAGRSWTRPGVMTRTSPPAGVWEPFGFWGPAEAAGTGAAALPPCALRAAYSLEYDAAGPGGSTRHEQRIAAQDSPDGGATWAPGVQDMLTTAGSRNGMPGLARLPGDGSWVLVCEGFWSPAGWGRFTVNLAASRDGGRTFRAVGVVYAPVAAADGSPRNAGSPQVQLCPGTNGTVAVSMMTNDATAAPVPSWPGGAFSRVSVFDAAAAAGRSFPSAPQVQLGASDGTFWPGLATMADREGRQRVAGVWGEPARGALLGGLDPEGGVVCGGQAGGG